MKEVEDQRELEKIEHERALFDFDEDINDLEKVEERYPADTTADAPAMHPLAERILKQREQDKQV